MGVKTEAGKLPRDLWNENGKIRVIQVVGLTWKMKHLHDGGIKKDYVTISFAQVTVEPISTRATGLEFLFHNAFQTFAWFLVCWESGLGAVIHSHHDVKIKNGCSVQSSRFKKPDGAFQTASRAAIIDLRMVFQVSPFSSISLGNIQPSQQMCSMHREEASSSQYPEHFTMSSFPLGSSAGQCFPVLSCEPAPWISPSFCATWKSIVHGRSLSVICLYAA